MKNKSYFIFLLFLLASCGYHFNNSNITTVSVPYIKEDFSGLFTEEIVKNISNSHSLRYVHNQADAELLIKITEKAVSQIGYKFDRDNRNRRKKNIRTTEGRQKIIVEAQLVSSISKKVLIGPIKISTDVDFDYVDQDSLNDLSFINSKGDRQTVLSLSLGQLESIDNAKEASLLPLYRNLALKVIDALCSRL